MEDPFMLSVSYKGKQWEFEARLQQWGFSPRFLVLLEGIPVFFERDEEGSYRAVLPPEAAHIKQRLIDPGLLKALAAVIESILS